MNKGKNQANKEKNLPDTADKFSKNISETINPPNQTNFIVLAQIW